MVRRILLTVLLLSLAACIASGGGDATDMTTGRHWRWQGEIEAVESTATATAEALTPEPDATEPVVLPTDTSTAVATITPTAMPTTPPPPTVTPVPGGALVDNVSVITGLPIEVDSLAVGKAVYRNRTLKWTSVPPALVGQPYLLGSNVDDWFTAAAYMTFTVNHPATVYVAYEPSPDGGVTLPAWLSDWQDTGKAMASESGAYRLYAKTYQPGVVTLGGNAVPPVVFHPVRSFGQMYVVIVVGGETPLPTVTPTPATTIAPTAELPPTWTPTETWTATPTPTVTPTPEGGALITGLQVQSSRAYRLDTLVIGAFAYSDRVLTVDGLSPWMHGLPMIVTANNDKTITTTAYIAFNLTRPATVYVAYAPSASLPAWLADGWVVTGDILQTSANNLVVYGRAYDAGVVVLGGNAAPPKALPVSHSNFMTFVQEGVAIVTATPTPTGATPTSTGAAPTATGAAQPTATPKPSAAATVIKLTPTAVSTPLPTIPPEARQYFVTTPNAPVNAQFSEPGIYVLQYSATDGSSCEEAVQWSRKWECRDGLAWVFDDVVVEVLPSGEVIYHW